MVAVKMELPEVFQETHKLIFEWLDSGKITGLRIDHPDGLWDPREYLRRLQRDKQPLYVVVEKILSGDEQLPADWPVEGTTGYDFLNRLNGLFVDGSKASAFDEIYRQFTGNQTDFNDLVHHDRKRVLEQAFASELKALTRRVDSAETWARGGSDFTFSQLRSAIEEIIANFPVYRTYITETTVDVTAQDRAVIQRAVRGARERAGAQINVAAFEFIERILLLDLAGLKSAREFVMKFQQLTGPAMAKGLEDTAFYQFNRLVSLNEVGGDPGKFGVTSTEFHRANSTTAKYWPHTMLASATHDTKRGEDVRARLNVLSEMPGEWRDAIGRWSRLNADKKSAVEGMPAPDANDEYLLYQTLVGSWPADGDKSDDLKPFRTRVAAFMLKAAKEAKIHTSWTEPNMAYEKALQDFVERVLAGNSNGNFLDDLRRFSRRVAFIGRFNSLAQTLLKLTSPGMPDVYQGSELWDLNLVDPDNRRPVDYVARRKLLSDLKRKSENNDTNGLFSDLLHDSEPGAMKLFLIWRVLNFRKTHRELFDGGDYFPLAALGERRDHVCAFARMLREKQIVAVVPRLVFGLAQGAELAPIGGKVWKETVLSLPHTRAGAVFRNVLTNETVAATEHDGGAAFEIAKVLKSFPVALLELQ